MQKKLQETAGRIGRVAKAYKKGGFGAANKQYIAEEKAYLKTLPIVRTYEAAKKMTEAEKKERFEKGLQTGRSLQRRSLAALQRAKFP